MHRELTGFDMLLASQRSWRLSWNTMNGAIEPLIPLARRGGNQPSTLPKL
jgi:hypothetical protein